MKNIYTDFNLNTYDPFKKTAIRRNSLSAPMKILHDKGLLKGNILDYATGHGLDFRQLHLLGYSIQGYDRFNPNFNNDGLLKKEYNTITNIYMFNVIADLQEHNKQLDLLKDLSIGDIYICVRSDSKAINHNTWKYNTKYDGWITSNNSFQRFYTEDMIYEYFGNVEFIHNGKDFKLFRLKNIQ